MSRFQNDVEKSNDRETPFGQIEIAQATGAQATGAQAIAQATGEQASAAPQVLTLDADNVSVLALPEGAVLDSGSIKGADLVFAQPDGGQIVILNGADSLATILFDGVETPLVEVAAQIQLHATEVAADFNGPGDIETADIPHPSTEAAGRGGSGELSPIDPGSIGDGIDVSRLLGPTELHFGVEFLKDVTTPDIDQNGGSTLGVAPISGLVNEDGLEGGVPGGPGDMGGGATSALVLPNTAISFGDGDGDGGAGSVSFTLNTTGLVSQGRPVVWDAASNQGVYADGGGGRGLWRRARSGFRRLLARAVSAADAWPDRQFRHVRGRDRVRG